MIEDILKAIYGDYLNGLDIYENKTSLILSRIVVKDEFRGTGIGSKIMEELTNYADKNNQIIALTPSGDFGGNKNRLIQFYKSFGFKHNKGQYKNFGFRDSMIRYPRMNETMKPIIKQLLRESLGVQTDVSSLSMIISNDIINLLKLNLDKIKDGDDWELITQIKSPIDLKMNTKISMVKTFINFKFTDKFKISALFKENKVILNDDETYNVVIELNLNSDNLELSLKYINGAISHELNHVYSYIKKLNIPSKSNTLNKVKNKTNLELNNLLGSTPALKEFMLLFYLSLPDEINARVQQTGSELNHINSSEYNETLEGLLKFKPIHEAKKLINYNLDSIKIVDENILKEFISVFNSNVKFFTDKNFEPKIILDTDIFFNYWLKIFNNSGDKLFKKIMKLVANKHNINESNIYNHLDLGLYEKITEVNLNLT